MLRREWRGALGDGAPGTGLAKVLYTQYDVQDRTEAGGLLGHLNTYGDHRVPVHLDSRLAYLAPITGPRMNHISALNQSPQGHVLGAGAATTDSRCLFAIFLA